MFFTVSWSLTFQSVRDQDGPQPPFTLVPSQIFIGLRSQIYFFTEEGTKKTLNCVGVHDIYSIRLVTVRNFCLHRFSCRISCFDGFKSRKNDRDGRVQTTFSVVSSTSKYISLKFLLRTDTSPRRCLSRKIFRILEKCEIVHLVQ